MSVTQCKTFIKKKKKNTSNQKPEYAKELLVTCITDWAFWALCNTEYK